MKPSRLLLNTLVFLVFGIIAVSCRQHPPLPSGAVVFQDAGVAIVPGQGWKAIRSESFAVSPDLCTPVLEKGEDPNVVIIQALSDVNFRYPPAQVAENFRKQVEVKSDTVKDSFKQEKFVTASGLTGICVSYDFEIQKVRNCSYVYIVQNAHDSAVSIMVMGNASQDFEPVRNMILKTLRLE